MWERDEWDMTKREYIKCVAGHLQCSGARKNEIRRQLDSHIEIALSEGRQLTEILTEMGDPKALAAEFNENLEDSGERKARKRRLLLLILGIVLGVLALSAGFLYWWLPKSLDIYDSTVFDSGQVEARSKEVINVFSEGDREGFDAYLSQELRDFLAQMSLDDIKGYMGEDWGALLNVGPAYMIQIREKGKDYAVAQINVSYENVSVTYTLTYDQEMELNGFYVR